MRGFIKVLLNLIISMELEFCPCNNSIDCNDYSRNQGKIKMTLYVCKRNYFSPVFKKRISSPNPCNQVRNQKQNQQKLHRRLLLFVLYFDIIYSYLSTKGSFPQSLRQTQMYGMLSCC